MSAKNTLQHDLETGLWQHTVSQEPPKLQGKWFGLGFSPDLATGERLNVGIVLRIAGEQHFRLFTKAEPFAHLCGLEKENIAFFLQCLNDHLAAGKDIKTFSRHIIVDRPKFAAGDSVTEILDRLYHAQVSLARHDEEQERRNLTTESLRSTIKQLVNNEHPAFSHYWQKEPIVLPGQKYTAAVDIYIPERQRFASIVSLDYRKDKSGRLAAACTELETAAQLGGEGTLFIYNPIRDSEQKDDTADVLIDRTYDLLRRHRLSCEVGNTPAQLAEQIPLLAS